MPTLILSSRYTTDSQSLRKTAQQLGWETLRLDGDRIPDWFDPPDEHFALFYTAPHAFNIAAQLSRTLLGCNSDWTVRLPQEFLLRGLRQTTLREALTLPGQAFIKPAVSKAFPATVYDAASLAEATAKFLPDALVHVGEPVTWTVEYRCFVVGRQVTTISPYQRFGTIIEGQSPLDAPLPEIDVARRFAQSVLESGAVATPPAFVLDVGMIESRGWAVVEFNECWASGIYSCEPQQVLETLLSSCVPSKTLTASDRRWDFKEHYFAARP